MLLNSWYNSNPLRISPPPPAHPVVVSLAVSLPVVASRFHYFPAVTLPAVVTFGTDYFPPPNTILFVFGGGGRGVCLAHPGALDDASYAHLCALTGELRVPLAGGFTPLA